ncbi:type II toxin-antitoxin system RelE/ParE family toxin [Patescibacteria group bacterium]|nr:type II toxin-antitoxin system RelE/ParE family toxin [Patescibacteria group bacterium]
MLSYSFHPTAEKELIRLPIKIQRQVIDRINYLCQFNHPLQCRKVIKIQGKENNFFRMRTGDYRIKFFLKDSIIKIVHVQHRQAGY